MYRVETIKGTTRYKRIDTAMFRASDLWRLEKVGAISVFGPLGTGYSLTRTDDGVYGIIFTNPLHHNEVLPNITWWNDRAQAAGLPRVRAIGQWLRVD